MQPTFTYIHTLLSKIKRKDQTKCTQKSQISRLLNHFSPLQTRALTVLGLAHPSYGRAWCSVQYSLGTERWRSHGIWFCWTCHHLHHPSPKTCCWSHWLFGTGQLSWHSLLQRCRCMVVCHKQGKCINLPVPSFDSNCNLSGQLNL